MTVLIEGKNSYFLGDRAFLVEDERDMASSWASKHIKPNKALKWILGKYVEADKANNNRQYWSLNDLLLAQPTISHAPMNMLHHPKNIVGAFVATEMMYPLGDEAAEGNAHIEALGAFWKYYFPDELAAIQRAHDGGGLFFSMECVANSITFELPDGTTSEDFAYRGPFDESYGDWGRNPDAIKKLNQPHFLGGALILPPAKPGWTGAEIKDLSQYVGEHAAETEALYESVKADADHLDSKQVEEITLRLIAMGENGDETTGNSIKADDLTNKDVTDGETRASCDDKNDVLPEGGDNMSKTYTEEEFKAILDQVEALNSELEELKNLAETEEVETRIAELTEQYKAEVEEVQKKLDSAVLEAEAVKQERDDIVAWLNAEAKTAEEVALMEARKDERLAAVKEVASFPEEYVEANTERWVAMSDEDFASVIDDYKVAAEAAQNSDEEDEDQLPSTTVMTASRDDDNTGTKSEVRKVMRLREQGIDIKTLV